MGCGEALNARRGIAVRLAKHFTLEELTFSQTAARRGWRNEPDTLARENLQALAAKLQEVRELVRVPVIVSSGYRSRRVNTAIGGHPKSAHMAGRAADIIAPPFTPYELAEIIAVSQIEFDKVILEFGRWVHFQIAERPRRLLYTAVREGDVVVYRDGLVA